MMKSWVLRKIEWLASKWSWRSHAGELEGVFGGDPDHSQHLLLSEVLPQAPRG